MTTPSSREELIRQVEEERILLLGMVMLLQSEPGDETAPVYRRTIARLESIRDSLKRASESGEGESNGDHS